MGGVVKAVGKVAMVVAAVAAIGSGIGAVLGGTMMFTAFGGAIAASAIAAGAGLVAGLAGMIGGGPQIPQSATQLGRLQARLDPQAPRKLVLGTTAMPADIRYYEGSGTDEEYVDYILAVAAHRVGSIDEIWFEDQLAWKASGGVQGEYVGYLTTVTTRLEGTAANTVAINGGTRWGADDRLTGCAYIHLRIKRTGNSDEEQSPLSSGLPGRVTIIGTGMPNYDPRYDSTAGGSGSMRADDQSTWGPASDDPIIQSLNVLLGWRINGKLSVGAGLPVKYLDLASAITSANICDESIALSGGGMQARYRTAGAFSTDDAPMNIVAALLSGCAGELLDSEGQLSFLIKTNTLATPVVEFDDHDVLGAVSWDPMGGQANMPNIISGSFTDPSPQSLYQQVPYPSVTLASEDGIERTAPVDFAVVENAARAQRLAKQTLQRMQYPGTFSAEFNMKGMAAKVGRVVWLTYSPLGFLDRPFRVVSQKPSRSGRIALVLREEHSSIYSWAAEDSASVQVAEPVAFDPRNSAALLLARGATTAATAQILPLIAAAAEPGDNLVRNAVFQNGAESYTFSDTANVNYGTGGVALGLPTDTVILFYGNSTSAHVVANEGALVPIAGRRIFQSAVVYSSIEQSASFGMTLRHADGSTTEVAMPVQLTAAGVQPITAAFEIPDTAKEAGFFISRGPHGDGLSITAWRAGFTQVGADVTGENTSENTANLGALDQTTAQQGAARGFGAIDEFGVVRDTALTENVTGAVDRANAGFDASGDLARPIPFTIRTDSDIMSRVGGGIFTGELDAERTTGKSLALLTDRTADNIGESASRKWAAESGATLNSIDGNGFFRSGGISTGFRVDNTKITEADAFASNLLRKPGGGGNFTGDLNATVGAIFGTNISNLPAVIQPGNLVDGRANASLMIYDVPGLPTMQSLMPAEAAANVTGNHTSLNTNNLGALDQATAQQGAARGFGAIDEFGLVRDTALTTNVTDGVSRANAGLNAAGDVVRALPQVIVEQVSIDHIAEGNDFAKLPTAEKTKLATVEANADETGTNTAAGFAGQSAWATFTDMTPASLARPNFNLIYDAALTLKAHKWLKDGWSVFSDVSTYFYTAGNSVVLKSPFFETTNSYWQPSQPYTTSFGGYAPLGRNATIYYEWYDINDNLIGTSTPQQITELSGAGRQVYLAHTPPRPTSEPTDQENFDIACRKARLCFSSGVPTGLGGDYVTLSLVKTEWGTTASQFTDEATYGSMYDDLTPIQDLQPAEPGSDVTATAQRTIESQYPVIEIKQGEGGHTGSRTVTHTIYKGTAAITGGTWSLPSVNLGAATTTIDAGTGTVTLSGIVQSGAYTVRYTHTDGIPTDHAVNVTYVPTASGGGTVSAKVGRVTSSNGASNPTGANVIATLTITDAPAGRISFGAMMGTSKLEIVSASGSTSYRADLKVNGTVVAQVPSQEVSSGGAVTFSNWSELFYGSHAVAAGTVTVVIEMYQTAGQYTGDISVTDTVIEGTVIAS